MTDYALPAWKIEQLKKFHKTLKQKHAAYRINAIILLGSGWTPTQVAEVLLISEEQEQELSQHLDDNLYQRSQDIQRYIAKKYKVYYSRSVDDSIV
jgi:hypothetical protein